MSLSGLVKLRVFIKQRAKILDESRKFAYYSLAFMD